MAHGSGPSPERRRAGCGMAATVCVRYSFPMRQAACATDIRRGAAGIDSGRKLSGSNSYIKTAQRLSRVFVTVTTS